MSGYARAAAAAALAAFVLTAAACGSGPQKRASSSARSGSPSPTATQAVTSPAVAAACDHTPWRQAPLTGTAATGTAAHAVITAVRAAQHPECGYDRLVIEIAGAHIAYSARYERQVVADASGQHIALPGSGYLVITLRPAQAHSDSGQLTVPRRVQVTSYPQLRSWVVSGDFEGVVSVALGLRDHPAIRVGTLPGRIYLDIAE